MESIWKSTVTLPEREKLPGDRKVHTVVIGAGMTGILTAYFLKKQGVDVVVVEADTIAGGQTQNTTAKITSQHGMIYHKLVKKAGWKRAQEYAKSNEEAIRRYEDLISRENIRCHFEKVPAYLYSTSDNRKKDLIREAEAANSLGIDARFLDGDAIKELPFGVAGAVCFENQAQFHPLEFIRHLAEELTIYEHTKVLSVQKHMVYTDRGDIYAKNIVFACHYPITNLPGFYFLRQHQERSYVLALEGAHALSGMYYGIDKHGLSLRGVGDVILLGGGGHRTGKNMQKGNLGKDNKPGCACVANESLEGYTVLRNAAQRIYPNAREVGAWSAQDCMPHDGIPFIGHYSLWRPYWYVATGFHKWGMSTAMIAAVNISEQIVREEKSGSAKRTFLGKRSIFEPQRCLVRAGFGNWIKDVGESMIGLSQGLFAGKEHRCPHMGCKLKWNKEENSWDCPCHGSRFSGEGKLLDNPAQINLTDERIS